MNDHNNEEFLGVGSGRLHTPRAAAPPAMENIMRDFASPPQYCSGSTSTAASVQLLSPLNGTGNLSPSRLSPLPGAVAGAGYGPAALNFFRASPALHANVATGAASFDTFTHNLGQFSAAGVAPDDVLSNGCTGFLNLFSKEGFGHDNTTPAPSASIAITSPYLQLQPLEVYSPLASPPTLFQKRAAQRQDSATPANVLPRPPAERPTPSSSSSKTAQPVVSSAAIDAYRTAMGSPSSFKSNSIKLGRNHMEWTRLRTSHAASFSSRSCEEGVGEMEDLVDDVDEGEDHLLGENETAAASATIRDRVGHLAPELEAADEDENCEALFHMSNPSHHMNNMMDGVGSELEASIDEQGASQFAATAGSASVSAAAERNGIDDTANRGGNGKGKVKGPPAKNLMAERRRRKKLNDRLYTLRSVVPKISKMDRASILGDAIEYLKELLQRINDLHNELESTAPDNCRAGAGHPLTPNSFMNQSSLTPTSATSNLPSNFVKLEESGPSASSMQVGMSGSPDQAQPPKIEVRTREGRALNIHMFCARRPGLLLSIMRALDGLGLDVQQAVISCVNGFALDVFRAEQSEDDVAADEIKRVLLLTATS